MAADEQVVVLMGGVEEAYLEARSTTIISDGVERELLMRSSN